MSEVLIIGGGLAGCEAAWQAIRLGADHLEVEYKDGCEEVCAMKLGIGWGIAGIPSSSPEAKSLRSELYALAKKKQRVKIDEQMYELRARIFDSFGEDAFRVELRRV